MSRKPEWDFFLAHAGEDKAIAEELYAALAAGGRARVFLDFKCLKLGDDWAEALAAAQRASRVTAVLVSEKTQRAYYQREEIAAAIDIARHDPGDHRVVPIYLDGQPNDRSSIPFGLRLKHGLAWVDSGGAAGVAKRLCASLLAAPAPERSDIDRQIEVAAILRAHLKERGESTAEIDAQIVDLKRRRRANNPSLEAGEYLLGSRFRLERCIGHGGFGDVWEAIDREANHRPVAIKVLHPQWARSEERRERFFRGARQMAALDHPGIVRVLHPKGQESGFSFYVMENFAGGDLKHAVLRGEIGAERALEVIRQVAAALHHAHESGLVHRDVKPENILLDGKGRAALTDFDLVHAFDTTGGTGTMASMGSFFYAAPEAHQDAGQVDRRADVYSLGVTTIFGLLGRSITLDDFRDWGKCVDGLDASGGVREVLRRAVAYERENRFESCAAFAAALRDAAVPRPAPQIEVVTSVAAQAEDPFQEDLRAAGLEWVEIPAGSFLMGSDGPESFDDERPIHPVHVSAFAMLRYPVTKALDGLFLADVRSSSRANRRRKRSAATARLPAANLSWHEANGFCRWLGERTGDPIRLPTEAEWEYACRAGSKTERYGELDKIARYDENSGERPHTVGVRDPNAWGLFDMLGNVYEWCADWYGPYVATAQTDPVGPPSGATRVLRGGSWKSRARSVRAARRAADLPDFRYADFGFRLVRGQGAVEPEPDHR